MKYFKASNKNGQQIIARANVWEGETLQDVYGTVSHAKENAYYDCMEKYFKGISSRDFHICSHNTFQYSVAWYEKREGEEVLRVETANNSYCVWLER